MRWGPFSLQFYKAGPSNTATLAQSWPTLFWSRVSVGTGGHECLYSGSWSSVDAPCPNTLSPARPPTKSWPALHSLASIHSGGVLKVQRKVQGSVWPAPPFSSGHSSARILQQVETERMQGLASSSGHPRPMLCSAHGLWCQDCTLTTNSSHCNPKLCSSSDTVCASVRITDPSSSKLEAGWVGLLREGLWGEIRCILWASWPATGT